MRIKKEKLRDGNKIIIILTRAENFVQDHTKMIKPFNAKFFSLKKMLIYYNIHIIQ